MWRCESTVLLQRRAAECAESSLGASGAGTGRYPFCRVAASSGGSEFAIARSYLNRILVGRKSKPRIR